MRCRSQFDRIRVRDPAGAGSTPARALRCARAGAGAAGASRLRAPARTSSTCWPICAGVAEARLVARREPVTDHGGQHGLHVLGQHAGVTVHQRPGLRGAQQRDHRARRQAGLELRAPGACSARPPARSRAAPRTRAPAARRPAARSSCCGVSAVASVGEQVAPVAAEQQLPLERRGRIAELDAHQEAVELRLRQRIRADLVRAGSASR